MRRNLILCGALAGLLTVASAEETSAPTLIYYDNTANVLDLTNATAWVGGVVPGSNDVAVFDGAVPATLNLGAETVWAGIVRTNVTAALTLQAPSNGTLALGAQGWRLSGTNQNFNRMYLVANVIAAADQTWFWCSNKTPCVTGSLAGPGTITLETLKDSWDNGVGNCIVEGPSTASVTVGVKNTLFVFGDARWNPPPTLQWDATLSLLPDRAADGTNLFSTIFPSRSFPLGGWLSFGVPDGNISWISQPRTFKLTAGDTICAHLTDATSDRQKGHLRVQDADVISDGATVTSNSWFDLRSGSWTQRAGDTAFNYAAIIGRLSAVNYGLQRQRLQIEGGAFTARRVNVGMGNCDKVPAVLRVTGGSLTCSDIAGAGWAAGLSIGQRVASGEENTYWDNKQNKYITVPYSDSKYAAGRMEISGGCVRTPSVTFGDPHGDEWYPDSHSAGRLALAGGELQIGAGGFSTGPKWRPEGATSPDDASSYDVQLTGGTLAFSSREPTMSVDARLANRDGGTTWCVSNGVTATVSGALSGAGGLRKTGPGTLCLTGANDYTGRTEVAEGLLAVGSHCEAAIWNAGDLKGLRAEGASVTPWMNRVGANTFTLSHVTSIDGAAGTTPATFSATGLGGHPAAVFDGANTCFLTGNQAQPFDNAQQYSVAVVFRTVAGFTGTGSTTDITRCTGLLGTSIADVGEKDCGRRYLFALDEEGRLGCGHFGHSWASNAVCLMQTESLWATNTVNDGKPHLAIWSWKYGGEHVLQVDGAVYRMSSPTNACTTTQRTRIVFGVNERQTDLAKRFRGAIAEFRMFGSQYASAAREAVAQELGAAYGVAGFTATAPGTPVVTDEAVPTATAIFAADSLAGAAGSAVTSWPEQDGKGVEGGTWTFTRDLAESVFSKSYVGKGYAGRTDAPVIAADTVNGHKLVSFNGTTAGLGLTGSKDTPAGKKDGLTVAAVVRFTGPGEGGEAFTLNGASPFLGIGYNPGENVQQWGLAFSAAGRIAAGSRNGSYVVANRSRRRFYDDGDLHVIVASWPKANGTNAVPMVLAVDGVRQTKEMEIRSSPIQNTRILLGCCEQNGKAWYVPVDVAEVRFWNGTVFTEAQIEATTRALAAKYGTYAEGYEKVATGCQQRSHEIVVASGASYGGWRGDGWTLSEGQTASGAGTLVGHAQVMPGAALRATTAGTLTVEHADLAAGAVLAADLGDGTASVQPVNVTGSLAFPSGALKVRLTAANERVNPVGRLLTWTGTPWTSGTPAFVVEGDYAGRVKAVYDATNKAVRLVRIGGTLLLVR